MKPVPCAFMEGSMERKTKRYKIELTEGKREE